MSFETQNRGRKKIAAALAAVEVFLRDEAGAASASARQRTPPATSHTISAWALAGRLSAMNARLSGGVRGRR